jgi:outer membrane protein assembly factor BamB
MITQVGAVPMLQVKWAFNTSDQFAGYAFGHGHQGAQTVWDIDADGKNEILYGTRKGASRRLWCIEQDGTLDWLYPPLADDPLAGDPWGVSLVDVDNDGVYEACVAGRGGLLHVINGDGTPKWIFTEPTVGEAGPAPSNMLGPPQAYDVDGDGYPEFFQATNSGYVHRVDHEGNLVWTSAKTSDSNEGHVTIADINRDDQMDVLFGSQDESVYCLESATGNEQWRFDTGSNMQTNAVFVADVNNDDEYECIAFTDAPNSAVFVISFYGIEYGRWVEPHGTNIRLTPALGDVDGDGNIEMAFMSGAQIYVIDLMTMQTEWEQNVTTWSETGELPPGAMAADWSDYPIIADIDGDDELEVLWLVPFPIVTDAKTGTLEAYYKDEFSAENKRSENGGWWGDVDQDGISEWLVEITSPAQETAQLYCLTMNGKFPAEATWPEYVHCRYPGEYQAAQDWLTLKGAYSAGCWFPMPEFALPGIAALLSIGLLLWRRK